MWLLCDKCSSPFPDSAVKECDQCGDFFCYKCNGNIKSMLSLQAGGIDVDFCNLKCLHEYIGDLLSREEESEEDS
jgi:hypothetical protein